MIIRASYLFDGFIDYWRGEGGRWDDNKGCLFAYYGPRTTIREIVDSWVEEFYTGGDCDSFPESVTGNNIRDAIIEMLSPDGRVDYFAGTVWDGATEFAELNDLDQCSECRGKVGHDHENCSRSGEIEWTDCSDDLDNDESPVCIVLIEVGEE